MIASEHFHTECVLILLQHGAEKDLQSIAGNTALMMDIKQIFHGESSYKTIDLLLQSGCNTNISDSEDQSPLYVAIIHNEKDIASKLLLFGANIFTETNYGMTPFLASIITRNYELAAYFIDMECFLSGCIKNQDWKQDSALIARIATILSPIFNKQHCEELNKLFFGAGETIPIGCIYQPHIIATIATEVKHESLMIIIRHAIRLYLLNLSSVNLIAQISKLPLPTSLKKFLYFS